MNVYIHIPFCSQKCRYCHFYSVIPSHEIIKKYFYKLTSKLNSQKFAARTIYFGGGTPSLVNPEYIAALLKKIPKTKNCEITLEANPETVAPAKLEVYKSSGINRLSFGLQAIQPQILSYLGRKATFAMFLKAFTESRQQGFNNIGVDLIFGIFGQTMAMWQETVKKVVDLNPEHISCYSLEPNKKVKSCNEDLDRKMYHWARKYLIKNGYHHYEISNFAKPGRFCRHNLDFWLGKEFLGFGTSAASFINKGVTKKELKSRKLFLNLRLIDGVKITSHPKQIKMLQENGLITYQNHILKLTPKGMDLENQVALELIRFF